LTRYSPLPLPFPFLSFAFWLIFFFFFSGMTNKIDGNRCFQKVPARNVMQLGWQACEN
jgi:hypothetical protein